MSQPLKRIVSFLDRELAIGEFRDYSNNGLQVQNKGKIRKICLGVDASMDFFQHVRDANANLAICHHGISWNDSLKHITDLNYSRIAFLIENDIALYGCHLPLDAHPKYGNNIQLCKALDIKKTRAFGIYNGIAIGFAGQLDTTSTYTAFKKKVESVVGNSLQTMDFGKKRIRSVAVVSGGAADELAQAALDDIDVYVTGEPKLSAYSIAQEYGINVIFAGHYATEVFGVKALAGLLSKSFNIPCEFLDLGITY